MNGLMYFRAGDAVYDIFSTKEGTVQRIKHCVCCPAPSPCKLSVNTGATGCITVKLRGGLTVQRTPRDVSKLHGFGLSQGNYFGETPEEQ